jgi:hypothetical protein
MNMHEIAPFKARFESLKDNENNKDKLIEVLTSLILFVLALLPISIPFPCLLISSIPDANRPNQDLLTALSTETKALSDTQLSLERERDVAIMYQQRHRKAEEELRRKLYDMECNTFVSVLIDGDCMNVNHSFPKFFSSFVLSPETMVLRSTTGVSCGTGSPSKMLRLVSI